jgi:UDP-glucose:(glucosyl)LPS alpha-1,2-glucosyltransferase
LEIPRNELNKNAFGGSELMMQRLYDNLPDYLLKEFQIIPTRLNVPLDPNKIRIAWIHDLAEDPQLNYLANGGWSKFHLLVFVSNWQMQSFIRKFNIPWDRCLVFQNAIEPFNQDVLEKPQGPLRLIYTPTPHRGLNILLPVFQKLLEAYPDLHLDVFSSFKLYGWEKRDEQFENLFEIARNNPNISYHGSQPNDVVRKALTDAHIFAYPSKWQETSCLCLIEAMSAGLICVHSNLAALPETSSNFTYMYQFSEDDNRHAQTFYNIMVLAINNYKDESTAFRLRHQKLYADQVYNLTNRNFQWKSLLENMLNLDRAFEEEKFVYNTGY